jgi:hypothetical protein
VESHGFYGHMDWNKVSPVVKAEIDAIGKRAGAQLWDLDVKLTALLDDDSAATLEE